MLKRISNEQIAGALEKLAIYKGCDLSECINSTDRAVAQAQLEADKKWLLDFLLKNKAGWYVGEDNKTVASISSLKPDVINKLYQQLRENK